MPGNPREMITTAERTFPVRIRIAVPSEGLGRRHAQITAWLDENCGAEGWAMTPSGTRGVLNDALSIYFADATLATAFVARWCVGAKVETAGACSRCARMSRSRGSWRGSPDTMRAGKILLGGSRAHKREPRRGGLTPGSRNRRSEMGDIRSPSSLERQAVTGSSD